MEATVIYPHQLFSNHPGLTPGRAVYVVEEPLVLTHNPIHRGKLLLHKLTMDAYQRDLESRGFAIKKPIRRLSLLDYPTTEEVFKKLHADGVTDVHIADTVDDYLERAIGGSGLTRHWYETPAFLLEHNNTKDRFIKSKRHMVRFYKQLRLDMDVLVDGDGEPTGGRWSFHEDNRQKIPKGTDLPTDIAAYGNDEIVAARDWVAEVKKRTAVETYGESTLWLPYTAEGAREYLTTFLTERFETFGPYEDAMTTRGVRLWHSALSPLLNIGLLTPDEVLDAVLSYAEEHSVPINSLEGFVRQLIGWREFMRASYVTDGRKMRSQNFWGHTRPLPDSYWTGKTGVKPVDHVIQTALTHGYTHHIDRLMVMGNFMLLSQLHPDAVYRWFMGMYFDAYDWVMVPNVYGMSQFADGGSFATKPYISGANYIKKMSDFQSGAAVEKAGGQNWEVIWTALYWHFIDTHKPVFEQNHRMRMMPKMLERMKAETKEEHMKVAWDYLTNI